MMEFIRRRESHRSAEEPNLSDVRTSVRVVDGEFRTAVECLKLAFGALQNAPVDGLTREEALAELEELKHVAWALPSVEHRLTARLADASPHELGATSTRELLANRLRIPVVPRAGGT